MNYLVDTHIIIWLSSDPKKIPSKTISILENPTNSIIVSVASIWEIIIKEAKGKLKLGININEIASDPNYRILNINLKHIMAIESLPPIHNDPFDRVLIAQSLTEDIPLITTDENILKYPIKTLH